jgi:adenine deaminase
MTDNNGSLTANVVDIDRREIGVAEVCWQNGVITAIRPLGPEDPVQPYLIPGFVDAHIHLESSLLPPAEFARLAVRHGTVATVSDPHEIANILGNDGVLWMLENVRQTPFHVLAGGAQLCARHAVRDCRRACWRPMRSRRCWIRRVWVICRRS